ncbi:hypothetical protein R1sor_010871 [Riccia sorocarpa]|uniref:RCC1-like domain-containing protein n=1 Tax=Riccia sorocarpa TaxID=122646 RepID=A0ABD3HZ91_9MARC
MALLARVRVRPNPSRCFRHLLSSTADGVALDEATRIELWSWGKNEVGQLGLGDEETRRSPALVTSMSLDHSAVPATVPVTSTATSFLSVENTGDLGFNAKNDKRVEASGRSTHSAQVEVNDKAGIACGLFHSCMWMDGKVWLWGKGGGGRLGLGSEQSRYSPTLLSSLTDVKSVALGGLHSVAVTHGGSVYTWGFGGFGALGHGSYTKELSPRKLTGQEWVDDVIHIAAGGSHTAAITSSGDLYTWGRDEGDGRLGHGSTVQTDEGVLSTPGKVRELNVRVAAVACGGFCTMALTPEGQLWSWGGNSNYELGRGDRKDDWRPKPIPSLEKTHIIQVSCGGYHAAALTADGKVLTWGHGGHGQLGHEGLESAREPAIVESLADRRVVSIACGGAWTAAVTERGELYTWGKNRDNQLGIPGLSDAQMNPALVEFDHNLTDDMSSGDSHLKKAQVVGVCAGATHGLCLAYGT